MSLPPPPDRPDVPHAPASTPVPIPDAPSPAGPRGKTPDGATSMADRLWAGFRQWPVMLQVIAWILAFYLLIPVLIWRSAMPATAKAIASGVIAFVVVSAILANPGEEGTSVASPSPQISSSSPTPSATPSPESTPIPTIKAPKLLGLSLAKAKVALQRAADVAEGDAALELRTSLRYSSKPKSTVIGVEPKEYGKPGTEIPSGNTVTLVLAKAIPTVPKVLGLQAEKATRELKDKGYSVRTQSSISSAAPGSVIAQSVPGGTKAIPERTTVKLTVAKPPPGYYVRVLGSGSALVTWGDIGTTHQVTVSLPFTTKVPSGGSFNVVTVVAQRSSGDGGSITCQIIHSGRVVKSATSSGAYAVCTASKST